MKRISFLLISAVIIVLVLFSLGYSERGIQAQEKRFALIIGNGSYTIYKNYFCNYPLISNIRELFPLTY